MIDASIYGSVRAPEVPNMLAQFGQVQQAAGLQRQNQLLELGLQDRQRSFAEQDQLRNALASLGPGATTAQRIAAAQSTGTQSGYGLADQLQKSELERTRAQAGAAKDNADAAATSLKTNQSGRSTAIANIANFSDPAHARSDLQAAVERGEIPQYLGEAMARSIPADPMEFRDWQMKAIVGITDPSKMAELLKPHVQTNNVGGSTVTQAVDFYGRPTVTGVIANSQSPDSAASNSLGYARLGEERRHNTTTEGTAAAGLEAGKWQYDADRGGVVNVRTGEFKPATQGGQPIGAKDKPLTDSQAKALGFGARMKEANNILERLAAGGTNRPSMIKQGVESIPFIGGVAGTAANAVASGPQQQVEQAQRDFVNAVLRRESGAAISEKEFEDARKQYFPEVNDKPENIAQKKSNREISMRGVLAEVPDAQRGRIGTVIGAPSAPAAATGVPDDIAALLKKHGG
jgi:hypothetical protein